MLFSLKRAVVYGFRECNSSLILDLEQLNLSLMVVNCRSAAKSVEFLEDTTQPMLSQEFMS